MTASAMPPAALSLPPLTLAASPVRRVLGTGLLGLLAALLVWVALDRPPGAPGWRLFLLGIGGGSAWLAAALWRASAAALRLTDEGLVETGGRVLARLDEMERIDRGVFALKPSNGFTLRLSAPMRAAWAPGLWWRLGRHLGVGGVTDRAQARLMADAIGAHLDTRRPRR